ncbi:MAG: beta-galactosidase, partial [Clostridia bacterium]|nr:beta-galactosidase [Clostridia bacterium]
MSSLTWDENRFYINGKPTKIVSGAMHYFRIMPEYWHDRLLKLKECGCNCVETYICWNLHEKREGEFDFSGALDFVKFLKTAEELGLFAIVRPGPFICSEWEFGGMPWWLLKYPDIKLRCSDKTFMEKCTPYLRNVGRLLKPQLITNGGNVIFVQIENEYGSYGNDKDYLRAIKNIYEEEGIDCPFITSDGDYEFFLEGGTLPDVVASVNYRLDGEGAAKRLKEFRKGQPSAVMELWNGWQSHWNEPQVRRDINEVAESVRSALTHSELVNIYMFHGGTSFGFMNGGICPLKKFNIHKNSYDVDAPLDEYGRRTPKYYAEQKVICELLGITPENTATDTEFGEYEVSYVGECSLSESGLVLAQHSTPTARPMEYYDQGYGYIIYETDIFSGNNGTTVNLPEIHDAAHIYLNGKYFKSIFRHDDDKSFDIDNKGYNKLQILFENLGTVNYCLKLMDHKGLVGDVWIIDKEITHRKYINGFKVYSLPLDILPENFNGKAEINAPAFYKYEFNAEKTQDTLVHFEG